MSIWCFHAGFCDWWTGSKLSFCLSFFCIDIFVVLFAFWNSLLSLFLPLLILSCATVVYCLFCLFFLLLSLLPSPSLLFCVDDIDLENGKWLLDVLQMKWINCKIVPTRWFVLSYSTLSTIATSLHLWYFWWFVSHSFGRGSAILVWGLHATAVGCIKCLLRWVVDVYPTRCIQCFEKMVSERRFADPWRRLVGIPFMECPKDPGEVVCSSSGFDGNYFITNWHCLSNDVYFTRHVLVCVCGLSLYWLMLELFAVLPFPRNAFRTGVHCSTYKMRGAAVWRFPYPFVLTYYSSIVRDDFNDADVEEQVTALHFALTVLWQILYASERDARGF